jgi:hypothetical protein
MTTDLESETGKRLVNRFAIFDGSVSFRQVSDGNEFLKLNFEIFFISFIIKRQTKNYKKSIQNVMTVVECVSQ